MEIQCYSRPGEYWKNRDVDPVAEWLSWASTVDVHSYVPSQLAWHLIEAERSLGDADIDTLRLIRLAREEVGAMRPIYNCGSPPCWNPDNTPKVRYSPNGAVIVESFASKQQDSSIWYRQEGRWIYPMTVPGVPQYHYLQWFGSTSAFTGKEKYAGYMGSGDGLVAEEPNPFQGMRWYPQEQGSTLGSWNFEEDTYFVADSNFHYEFGIGRGDSKFFGVDSHGHIVQVGEASAYSEWPSSMIGGLTLNLDAGPGKKYDPRSYQIYPIRVIPSITSGGDSTFYTEESIMVHKEAVGFPCSWLRSDSPPMFYGEARQKGIPTGVAFGGIVQNFGSIPPPKEFVQATYKQVSSRAASAVGGGDLGMWVQGILSQAPNLGYDHYGWGVGFVDDIGAPIYFLVRFGWVHLRGTMHVSTNGEGSWSFGIGGGEIDVRPKDQEAWFTCPGWHVDGNKRLFDVRVSKASLGTGTAITVLDAHEGDRISLDSIMWSLS
jgi:hypothetical protein